MVNNKKEEVKKDEDLHHILFAVAIIMGFIFIVSISIYLIKEHYDLSCSCKIALPIIIAVLASLGVFVGILTYYFLSKSFSKEKEKIFGNVEKTLNFLNQEEKSILSALIENKGVIAQNDLSNVTKIDAVKLHRRLLNLESKDIVHKMKNGMTNRIVLNDDFKVIFIR